MQHHILSRVDRAFVEEARANTRDKLTYMKLSVLVLLDEGLTQETTAMLLGISLGTVNNCKRKYERESLDRYLDQHYVPYQGRLEDSQLAELEDEVRRTVYPSCAAVGTWIQARFGVAYSPSAVRAILTKLGFSYKKTQAVPGGLDGAEQEAFLAEMEPFLAEVEADEAVFFLDAVHPQHNTRSDYAWIKQGERFPIATNTGRKRVNLNGAMNFHHPQEVVTVEAERIDEHSTIQLCQKLLEAHADKVQIYAFCDNASYYKSTLVQAWLAEHPKLTLIHLPPYSPNLNLIERLWKFLRKKVINTTYYRTFLDFRRAIHQFLDRLGEYEDELRSLMRPNFQRFSVSPKI